MVQKHFFLEETDIEILDKVRLKMGMNNSAEALRFIIRYYSEKEKQNEKLQVRMLREIEAKVELLLDVANTDLIKRRDEVCYPVSMIESPVIRKAKEVRKSELAHRKQEKDYRNRKQQTE